MPGVSDYLAQAADAFVQAGLVSYFFVHYLMKGRSDLQEDEPTLCLDNKPSCCLHGDKVPQKSKPAAAAEKAADAVTKPAWRPTAAPQAPQAPQAPSAPAGQSEPPWLQKAAGRYANYEKLETSPISKIQAVPTPTFSAKPGPPAQQTAPKTSYEPQKADVKDFIGDLKHEKPLHYPSAFEGGAQTSPSQQIRAVFTPSSSSAPPPPPAPPSPGVPKVQIPFRPSAPTDGMPQRATIITQKVPAISESSRKSPLNRTDDGHQESFSSQPALLMMPEQPQIRAHAPRIIPAATRPFSPPKYEPEEPEDFRAPVVAMSKQWPPPSNATGVEFYKDIWGAPVEAAPVFDTNIQVPWSQPQSALFEPLTLSPGRMTSSFFSAPDTESDLGTPRVIRNPQGDLQDYTRLSREDPEPFTNMMSQDKSQELAKFLLQGEVGKGKGVQMFSRQRERVEQYTQERAANRPPAVPIAIQRDVQTSKWLSQEPPVPPQRKLRPSDIVDSVTDAAAARREGYPPPSPGVYNTYQAGDTPHHPHPPPLSPAISHPPRTASQRPLFSPSSIEIDTTGTMHEPNRESGLFSPGPTSSVGPPMPSVNRLFSPTPFSAKQRQQGVFSPVHMDHNEKEFTFGSPPAGSSRPFSPGQSGGRLEVPGGERMSQFGVREGAPKSWSGTSANKSMTMSTIAVTTPTTRIVTSVSPRRDEKSTTSTFNTLPRTWKSFSEAYRN